MKSQREKLVDKMNEENKKMITDEEIRRIIEEKFPYEFYSRRDVNFFIAVAKYFTERGITINESIKVIRNGIEKAFDEADDKLKKD